MNEDDDRPGNIRIAWLTVLIVAVAALLLVMGMRAQAKNWDRDAAVTEAGKIRGEYLSRAGALPTYRDGQPTGAFYHGNCCGEADAYEADDVFVDADGNLFAVLTCNDPDDCKEVPGTQSCGPDEETGAEVCAMVGAKITRPPGSRWLVPPDKVLLNHDPVNNTGHGWIWISPNSTDGSGQPMVYCRSDPGGA